MFIREAKAEDIATLAIHHKKMFQDIWEKAGKKLSPKTFDTVRIAYKKKIIAELEAGICKAWVVESKKEIVSSGAMTFISLVPNPSDLSSKVAYLHSLYTEKDHRNRQYSQSIIQKMIAYCKSEGIKRVILNASPAGQPIYEKLGFKSAPDSMRLFID